MRFDYYIKKAFADPFSIGRNMCFKLSPYIKSDKLYLQLLYYFIFHKRLNLKKPFLYSEKLQWLKLYDHNPEYTIMVDKVKVKKWVADKLGTTDNIIPTLGIWESAYDIEFSKLPDKFVLKCNHNSHGLYICYDKNFMNKNAVIDKLEKSLHENFYLFGREWPYKDVPRRVFAEVLLEEQGRNCPNDYKVLCFNGEPKLIEVHQNRNTDLYRQDFYDCNWVKTDISQNSYVMTSTDLLPKPTNFNKMLELSRLLSINIPHCRIDWYDISGHLYFGEITFFDGSGFCKFDNEENEILLGSWIDI